MCHTAFSVIFPYCLSISVGQLSSDNGLPHVSLKVSIEDTEHEGLLGFKKLLFLSFTTWIIGGSKASLRLCVFVEFWGLPP